jgi:hypothetical protein
LPKRDKGQPWVSSRRAMLVMMSLSTLYNYLYSMSVGNAYGLLPILGGALFMSGAVASTYTRTFLGKKRKTLPRRLRVTGTVLLVVMLLFSLAVFTVYPIFSATPAVWALFAVVLALTMRAIFARRLVTHRMQRHIGRTAFILLYTALQIIPAGVVALLLFTSLPATIAWQTLGGYGLSVLLETYNLWRERRTLAQEHSEDITDPQAVEQTAVELRSLHAYGAYQRMHLLILIALQVTLVMVYTFIGITSEAIIICLALTVGCTITLREVTDWILTHLKRRRPAILQLLLIGLFLWVYSLVLFYRQLANMPNLLLSYLTLGLCSSGLSVTVTCLAQMELEMTDVAEYGLQNHMAGYDQIRAVYTEVAILLGQMVALLLLAILCLPAVGLNWKTLDFTVLFKSFRPLMVVPPLLLLASAIISVLHFPMNNRHFEKLRRFLTLRDGDNPALKRQLDEVVVKKHKNRFGVKLILLLLRPLYYHKVRGLENAAGHEDGTMVLVCNHGELYGPVVTNLYMPISFRPWCISSMMEKDVIVRYIYENTLVRQKWLPKCLKMPLTQLLCPLCLWVLNSLEAIPVYRSNPRELIKTFRLTIEAMQAGDNILVFPERGEAEAPGQKGYVTEGVGDLYTGFAMIAPAFYQRTHKRAVFVPIYASKHLRTLTFGQCVEYNPNAPATQEKLRIVNELTSRMAALYAIEQAELARRRQRRREHLRRHRTTLKPKEQQELEALEQEDGETSPLESPASGGSRV